MRSQRICLCAASRQSSRRYKTSVRSQTALISCENIAMSSVNRWIMRAKILSLTAYLRSVGRRTPRLFLQQAKLSRSRFPTKPSFAASLSFDFSTLRIFPASYFDLASNPQYYSKPIVIRTQPWSVIQCTREHLLSLVFLRTTIPIIPPLPKQKISADLFSRRLHFVSIAAARVCYDNLPSYHRK